MNAPLTSTNLANPFSKWFDAHPALDGKSLMERLFDRLDGAYPHKWRSNFPNAQAIDNWMTSWAEAFEEEGVTPADIKAGLKACRSQYEWPPSCAEFIKACRPSVSPTVAYYEAIKGLSERQKGEMGTWSHPAIYWAAVQVQYELMGQTYSQAKALWERTLQEQMAKKEWPDIPNPLIALPPPGKTHVDLEEATKRIAELHAEGVIKKPNDNDQKLWAKKIMKRLEDGDKTLSSIQIQFAKRALSVKAQEVD